MDETARLFFALWPPAELVASLGRSAEALAARHGGKPTRPQTIHLTLAFLGKVPLVRLPELEALARAIHVPPFSLTLDRIEAWPHKRLAWVGCRETPAALADLCGILRSTVKKAGFPYHGHDTLLPHVTLVRKLPPEAFPWETEALEAPLAWPVDRFCLVRSRLSAQGPAYGIQETFSLA